MRRSGCGLALAAAVLFATTTAYAQLADPQNRVPGFGGTYSGAAPNTPGAFGSDVGSNIGAGANASPISDEALPLPPGSSSPPEIAQAPDAPKQRGLFGLSRELPLNK